MKRALLAASITLGVAALPVCLIVSGAPLFAAPAVEAPQVVRAEGADAAATAPSGTDAIILSLAAGVRDPLAAARTAVELATAGTAAHVTKASLIGPRTVSVTLDTTLGDTAAAEVTRTAAKQAGVTAADQSLTFQPAETTIPSYEWNLAGSYGVDAAGAWKITKGTGVVVGVVDTGIAANSALPAAAQTLVTRLNGQLVSGTTGANMTVTVRNAVNQQLCITKSDASGTFNCAGLVPRPSDGAVLTVTATDAVGRTSSAKPTVADASTTTPTIAPTNGRVVTGTAEPAATIALTRGTTALGTATVDARGDWSFTVPASVRLKDGDIVTAIATDPSGNVSEAATRTVDQVPPAAPVLKPTRGGTVTGTKEAGSFVTITWDGSPEPLVLPADDATTWTATLDPRATHDSTITVTATDAAGNTSDPGTVKADAVAPNAPVLKPTRGETVTGTKEAGSFITLTWTGQDGEHHLILDADNEESWTADLSPEAIDASVITATATDAAGNTSAEGTVTADSTAPAAPTIAPSNGSTLSGTAEPGATISITYHHDNTDAAEPVAITTNGNGGWALTPPTTHLVDGDTVTVIATDASGNTSEQATVTIDAVAPVAPVIDPSSGKQASGTKEPGSFITVSWIDQSRTKHTERLAATDSDTWRHDLSPAAANDSMITATTTDAAGNTSEIGERRVDATAPATPIINPSNGSTLSGSAEPASTITITYHHDDADVPETAAVTADADGRWSLTPSVTLADKDTVTVAATDEAGNVSDPVTITIDAEAPAAPVLAPTKGIEVSGTKEAGSFVTISWTAADGPHTLSLGADEATTWLTTLSDAALDGTVISVTATDAAGNTSAPGTTKADSTPPAAPVLKASNGTTVSGTKEAGSFVTVTWDGSESPLVLAPSDATTWTIPLDPAATDGSKISATATDAAGNVSPLGSVVVDSDKPDAPEVLPTNGRTITGQAEPGALITIRYESARGDQTKTTTADATGAWSRTLRPRAVNGSEISVTATDASGNESVVTKVVADATAPELPNVEPSNGHVVSISGVEPGTTPTLVDEDGDTYDGTWLEVEHGSWTFTLPSEDALAEDDVASVVLTDAAGNRSTGVRVVVDTTPPEPPAISAISTAAVSGTAEAGTHVTVSYSVSADETPEVQAAVDKDGVWSAPLSPEAFPGSPLEARATDEVGNTSSVTSATVPGGEESSPDPITSEATQSASPTSDSSDGVSVANAAQGGMVSVSSTSAGTAMSTASSATGGTNLVGAVLPGYDFVDSDTDPGDASATSHGTHVAGIVAASGASSWLPAGVAPMAQIEPLRALDSGSNLNNMQYVINAINWGAGIAVGNAPANDHPVDVLNLSVAATSSTCPVTLQDAINTAVGKGVVVVAAAGNSNASIASTSPANCANVIVATASTATGDRASYSNWGTSETSSAWLVAAPGGSGDGVSSCDSLANGCPGGVFSTIANSFQAKSGTSMSAPHVAGVAALLKAIDPDLAPTDIARIIRGTAAAMSDGCPSAVCGTGIVNAASAVAAASDKTSVTVAGASSPRVSVSLSISGGTAQVGTPLTAVGTSSYSQPVYQWLRNGTAITGATTPYYQLTGADYLTNIQVRVSTTIGGSSVTSAAVRVSTKGIVSPLSPRPAITATNGKAASYKVKKTIKATVGSWSVNPTKATYQWYRGSKKIKKATKATYKLTKADRGKKIKIKVTVSATGYYTASAYSASHKVKR